MTKTALKQLVTRKYFLRELQEACRPQHSPPPPPIWDWKGYPPVGTGWGYPHWDWMGYPPLGLDGNTPLPIGTGWGYLICDWDLARVPPPPWIGRQTRVKLLPSLVLCARAVNKQANTEEVRSWKGQWNHSRGNRFDGNSEGRRTQSIQLQ